MNLRDLFNVGTKLKEGIFCQQNGPERGQVKMVVVPVSLNVFFRVFGYCSVLIKIKAMSLYLFLLFEEMVSKQFF